MDGKYIKENKWKIRVISVRFVMQIQSHTVSMVMRVSGYFPLASMGERRRDSFTKGNFYPARRQKSGTDREIF